MIYLPTRHEGCFCSSLQEGVAAKSASGLVTKLLSLLGTRPDGGRGERRRFEGTKQILKVVSVLLKNNMIYYPEENIYCVSRK